MTFFDSADSSYYPAIAWSTLFCYITGLLINILTLAFVAYRWKKLPVTFRISAVICSGSICLANSVAIFYLTTLKTVSECIAGRKVKTVINRADLVYTSVQWIPDYQLLKIRALTQATQRTTYILATALLVRMASYIFNIVDVSSGLLVPLSPYPDGSGRSTCSTKFDPYAVYQEHTSSLIYELLLVFLLAQVFFVQKMAVSAYIKQFLDFEVISFGIYLLVEVVYLVCYANFPRAWISMLNTFYISVPVLLFALNVFAGVRRDILKSNNSGGFSKGKKEVSRTKDSRVSEVKVVEVAR